MSDIEYLEEELMSRDIEIEDLKATITRLKRYECSWTDCGAQKKNKELQAEVEELEEFVKHDYISMKNWQEEKAALQAKVEELTNMVESLCDLIRSQSSRRVSDDCIKEKDIFQ